MCKRDLKKLVITLRAISERLATVADQLECTIIAMEVQKDEKKES